MLIKIGPGHINMIPNPIPKKIFPIFKLKSIFVSTFIFSSSSILGLSQFLLIYQNPNEFKVNTTIKNIPYPKSYSIDNIKKFFTLSFKASPDISYPRVSIREITAEIMNSCRVIKKPNSQFIFAKQVKMVNPDKNKTIIALYLK